MEAISTNILFLKRKPRISTNQQVKFESSPNYSLYKLPSEAIVQNQQMESKNPTAQSLQNGSIKGEESMIDISIS